MGVRAVKVSTLRALGHNFSLAGNCVSEIDFSGRLL